MMRLPAQVLGILAISTAITADVVHLKNGDRISGEIEIHAGDKLKLKTPYSGEILIDWEQVASLETDGVVPVQLKNGEHFKGRLVLGDTGLVRIVSEAAGQTQPIAVTDIEAIRKSKDDMTEAEFWSGQLSVGIAIQDGNVRRQDYHSQFEAVRETEGSRFTFRGYTTYTRESGQETGKHHFGQFKADAFFLDPAYLYAMTSFEYDRFAGIDLRTTLSSGLGYRAMKTDTHDLNFELGGAYVDENRRKDEDDDFASLRAAGLWRWKISDKMRLRSSLEFYPNLENTDDFIAHGEILSLYEIFKNLNLNAGLTWDHKQQPAAGNLRNDTQYLLGVTYRF